MNCFYFPQLKNIHTVIDLDGDEHRHIAGARRLKIGDKLLLFNGEGLIANTEITTILKNRLSVSVINIEQLNPPIPEIVLASAVPKGDRINSLLDMSTQLGMNAFIPLMCERSITQVNDNKMQRFKRICINACKQSRRYFVPKVHGSTQLSDLLEQFNDSNSSVLVADPNSQPFTMNDSIKAARSLVFLVGPEGGFTQHELGLMAEYDVRNVKLSDAILRIETACVCMLSQISNRQMH